MTPERKLDLIKIACCIAMFSAVIAVDLIHTTLITISGIVVVVLSLVIIQCTLKRERALLEAERDARIDRFMATVIAERNRLPTSVNVWADWNLAEFPQRPTRAPCRFYVGSMHLRCTVNPCARSCSECKDYQTLTDENFKP